MNVLIAYTSIQQYYTLTTYFLFILHEVVKRIKMTVISENKKAHFLAQTKRLKVYGIWF